MTASNTSPSSFDTFTEPNDFSKAIPSTSHHELQDMDVSIIVRRLGHDGTSLWNYKTRVPHGKSGTIPEDVPDLTVYKYVGPRSRLRAFAERLFPGAS